MIELPITADVWETAQRVLTAKQLQVLTLREKHGFSWNQICITLDISRATARDHHAAATRNVYNAIHANGAR